MKSKIEEAVEELKILIRARYPIIYIQSNEKEMDIIREILKICVFGTKQEEGKNKFQKKLILWDIVNGFTCPIVSGSEIGWKPENTEALDAITALDFIRDENKEKDQIFVLLEFHHYLEDVSVQRRLRVFSQFSAVTQRKMIIILSPKNDGVGTSGKLIPTELENIVHLFNWPYPDDLHIKKVLTRGFIPNLNEGLTAAGYESMKFDMNQLSTLVDSCKGMTVAQIDNATSKSVVKYKTLVPSEIAKEKKQIITKSGLCEYVEPNQLLKDIGGHGRLKRWLQKRKDIQSEDAYNFGCDLPRGVLFLGPWGSGKSSAAKAVINEWGIPGLRIDASKIFSMYLGQSEKRIYDILSLAESIAPCILWFEEVENLLSTDGGSNDGGASSRVLGIISTWMSEHEGMVFVIFTANDISNRPPKLFRKGRLDEIFIVDLPVFQERVEILQIHVNKRIKRRDKEISSNIDYNKIADYTKNFSGAELEAAVNSAFIDCFYQGKSNIETEDILKACQNTIPLSQTMKENILEMRKWQKGRAVRASDYEPEEIVDTNTFIKENKKILDFSE